MGCSGSKKQPAPAEAPPAAELFIDCGPFYTKDGTLAGKASRLYAPGAGSASPSPAVVMVHGSCSEIGETNKIIAGALGLSEGFNLQWFYMENVAEWVAGQGYAVLMIGLSDDDGAGYADGANGVVDNSWPSAAYSKFLLAAIDHLAGSAAKANVPVDASRVALFGHSLGGGGVLHAAARDCKDRVKAVVAVNPGCARVDFGDCKWAEFAKWKEATPRSGEFGECAIPHLADVAAPTLIFGSQAEYNAAVETYPRYDDTFAQVGAACKELYVDNLEQTWQDAHTWCSRDLRGYADGKPAELIASFLSRHLAGVEQAPPEKPSNAKEWVVVTAPTSEAAIRLDEPGAPEPNPEAPGDPSLLCAGACAV